MPKTVQTLAVQVGGGLLLLIFLILVVPNRTKSAEARPEALQYSMRDLIITVPSSGWDFISHDDYSLYLQSPPFEAKLDASYTANDKVNSLLRRWATRSWVWDFYNAQGTQVVGSLRSWDVTYRLERSSVVFVAFHPFGLVLHGRASNEAAIMQWLRQIDILQRG